MKAKVWQEIRSMSDNELELKLKDLQEELFHLEFRHLSVPLKNPLQIRVLKRTVAKVKTLLKEKASLAKQGR